MDKSENSKENRWNMSLNTFKQRLHKLQSSKGSTRFLPYAPTPHEYRKKLPHPTFNCGSCAQVSEQWSSLFHDICDRYEQTYNELQSVSTQLSALRYSDTLRENAKRLNIHRNMEKSTQIDNGAPTSHAHTQTMETKLAKSTQTEKGVQTSLAHTQTLDTKRAENGSNCDEEQENQLVTCSRNFNLFYRYTTMHDHSYAKGTAITDHPGLAESQDLYECRVCSKIYSYDKMRKHYLQFINRSSTRINRYAHSEVSIQTHQRYLDELKASKPRTKYF